jgi:hypothetical protein
MCAWTSISARGAVRIIDENDNYERPGDAGVHLDDILQIFCVHLRSAGQRRHSMQERG